MKVTYLRSHVSLWRWKVQHCVCFFNDINLSASKNAAKIVFCFYWHLGNLKISRNDLDVTLF